MAERELTHAFVLTVSASMSLACSPSPNLPGNPPLPQSTEEPEPVEPVVTASVAEPQPAPPKSGAANPTDAKGRHIRLSYNDDSCFVYLDFPPLRPGEMRPPGSAPPEEKVACPPVMRDPAYASCRGGVVNYKGESCECFVPGNPPRVVANACPAGPS